MALIKCPECGADISDKALQCPKCGYNFNSAQITSAPNAQSSERQRNRWFKWVRFAIPIGLVAIILGSEVKQGSIGGGEYMAIIIYMLGIFFLCWLYNYLKKQSPSLAQNQFNVAPTASELTNWRAETPRKAFSGSVRASTTITAILVIILSGLILFLAYELQPDITEKVREFTDVTDVFAPTKIGVCVMIAVNLIAMIIAIVNRNNNSNAVATGIIGTLMAGGITMLMQINMEQSFSQGAAIFHKFSGGIDESGKISAILIAFAGIVIIIYMIIAASIAVVRRRHVVRLMAYPAADKQAMQQYCSNRTTMIFIWILLIISTATALGTFIYILIDKY